MMNDVIINEDLARRLVSDQFPQWAELPIRPVEMSGWDNRTYRLGDHMSIRMPSAAPYATQVAKEQRWLPRLAPFLPLPIPSPLAMGIPAAGYPWNWSVYSWLKGEQATIDRIHNMNRFATSLGRFLVALQRVDASGGPSPGASNFHRGGDLVVYDGETREAIEALRDAVDARAALKLWEAALEAEWNGAPVWLHGDLSASNLLVDEGDLSAVIDFGCSAVGDPSCDLTIAWTFFSGESREAFRETVGADGACWARARGWALWKGLITFAQDMAAKDFKAKEARRVIDEVIAEHESMA